MKKIFVSLCLILLINTYCKAQQNSKADGDWSKQFVTLKNTPEADLMIRVGDIDNLGFGWAEGFNPFSGKATDTHTFPWEIDNSNAPGTDRIIVPSSFQYGSVSPQDGYSGSTERQNTNPTPIIIPLKGLENITVNAASLQLFIDDFQSPEFESKFQFKINGIRFTEAEKMLSTINQSGPRGKLITIRLTDEFLQLLKPDAELKIFIDDPTTGFGDGFAIDFAKLLINPKGVLYKGMVKGKIIDADTKNPIAQATAGVKDYGSATTDANGDFLLNNIPAGLGIVNGYAPGYSSAEKQVDVIADETSEEVLLELKHSGKVKYNNKALQEGDKMVMSNVQFEVNSATLLLSGQQELDKLAAFMKENAVVEILLAGYTSSEGSAISNKELSLKRVRSCKNYLAEKGIDEGRVSIRGFGAENPVAPNDTEPNRAKNRRVEMKITKL